jgi:hypothetical protein
MSKEIDPVEASNLEGAYRSRAAPLLALNASRSPSSNSIMRFSPPGRLLVSGSARVA